MTLGYVIPLPPVTKKNHQQIRYNKTTKRLFIGQSKQYEAYAAKALWFLKPAPPAPIDFPVTVRCVFYMPTRRRVDKSNLEACVHDLLVKAGVLADDNRDVIASTDGSRVYYDKSRPRTEVYIEPGPDGYEQWKEDARRGSG